MFLLGAKCKHFAGKRVEHVSAKRPGNRFSRMSKQKFRLVWLVPILLWLALPVIPVQAHANLVNSNPTPGQAMPEFPASIELDFSEAVNDGNAQAKLYNARGELVATGKIEMDMASPKVLRVVLPAQPDGVYSLA